MSKDKNENTLKSVGTAIGVGLIAGFVGTIVMTVCQKIEMEISGRKASQLPQMPFVKRWISNRFQKAKRRKSPIKSIGYMVRPLEWHEAL